MFLYLISGSCQEKMYEEFQDFSPTGTGSSNLLRRGTKWGVIMAFLFHAVNNQTPAFSLQFRVKKSRIRVPKKRFQGNARIQEKFMRIVIPGP